MDCIKVAASLGVISPVAMGFEDNAALNRQSIGVEICEFRNLARQSAAIDRAAHLTAALANRYDIPTARIVSHRHWRRVEFKYGKPCPWILLERDRRAPGGWRLGSRWERFVARVEQHRRRSEEPTTARFEVGPYEIEPSSQCPATACGDRRCRPTAVGAPS
jgi:N-acetylmuramoyl-L-alanine amidase CwlA